MTLLPCLPPPHPQLEGTEGLLVDSCVFERLDGMALLLSGYNRNAHLTRNTFKWIGDSAMVSWGRTTGDVTGQDGWDGTGGDQPRYNLIDFNFASELGIWEKQSSLYMQARGEKGRGGEGEGALPHPSSSHPPLSTAGQDV